MNGARARARRMSNNQFRYLRGSWTQIVLECAREQRAIRRVGHALEHGSTEPVRKAALDLSIHHRRIEKIAGIVHAHIFVDRDVTGLLINLERSKVALKAVRQRRAHAIVAADDTKPGRRKLRQLRDGS